MLAKASAQEPEKSDGKILGDFLQVVAALVNLSGLRLRASLAFGGCAQEILGSAGCPKQSRSCTPAHGRHLFTVSLDIDTEAPSINAVQLLVERALDHLESPQMQARAKV
ncbi:hypothetical protein PMI36_06041 [Pseudomonas sp. GM79]|nr:hypothetical protein PMI36_06041 [Pseudomonas sp. GM79]